MTRSLRATLVASILVVAVAAVSVPAVAHSPDPLIGWPAWNQDQVVRWTWKTGEVPPAAMRTPIFNGTQHSNSSKGSRAPTFVLDAAGASTVEYGADVFCGVNGLACADARNAPNSFRVAFRLHGWAFDWGRLRWCQMLAVVTDGCYDVENIMLDEVGHVHGLAHHGNFADESDYGDAVVQTVSRARPKPFWNKHTFGRCDVATLQTRYDMTSWQALYSTCLNLAVTVGLAASDTTIGAGSTITFTATMNVADNIGDGRLSGNPISNRRVVLQRRLPGGTTWTSIADMVPATTAGTYTLRQSPTATYDWRAVFPKPAAEGLRSGASGAVRVSVSTCSGTLCPTALDAEAAAVPGDGR